MKRPHVVLIGHYPLDRLDRAPKVRIYHMAEAFARLGTVTLMAGTRTQRREALPRLLKSLPWDEVDAVYVESASSTAVPADIQFLRALRRQGVPVGIFVRDAYQLFPHLYPQRGLKARTLMSLYRLTLAAYRQWASALFVPTPGMARAIGAPGAYLLPPGASLRPRPDGLSAVPRRLIYVGAGGAHDGVDRLVQAMPLVLQEVPDASLLLVMRPGEAPDLDLPPWIERTAAHGEQLSALLWQSAWAVIPRVNTSYHQIALPVKLFDYLSHGLPVVVTGPSDMAEMVTRHHLGAVSHDDVESLAATLVQALKQPPEQYQDVIGRFVADNRWEARAGAVLTTLQEGQH